jgi:hypothetical protein
MANTAEVTGAEEQVFGAHKDQDRSSNFQQELSVTFLTRPQPDRQHAPARKAPKYPMKSNRDCVTYVDLGCRMNQVDP